MFRLIKVMRVNALFETLKGWEEISVTKFGKNLPWAKFYKVFGNYIKVFSIGQNLESTFAV